MHRHTEPGIVVEISKEGLRRAYRDNAALLRSSRLHEVAAACACVAGTVLIVAWFVDSLARGLS
ncbi:hypothetical protein [Trinickia sp.]|uniref:hypothetical protein n=1 Tax=Trinickia sp. TaxID=2571163 RepID=UPI003F7E5616